MGLLFKDLKERNDVYDELIKHFKGKMSDNNTKSIPDKFLELYDYEIEKADRGDAYLSKQLIALGFGGLAVGIASVGFAFNDSAFLLGSLASAGVSAYNYIRFKNLSLGRGLATRMMYAEELQNRVEENNFKYPFRSGNIDDYDAVENYVDFLKEYESGFTK